jgi:hypothetical protein
MGRTPAPRSRLSEHRPPPSTRLWGKCGDAHVHYSVWGAGSTLPVTDCNRNWSGLQSTEIWDRIICIYLSLQDGILCN